MKRSKSNLWRKLASEDPQWVREDFVMPENPNDPIAESGPYAAGEDRPMAPPAMAAYEDYMRKRVDQPDRGSEPLPQEVKGIPYASPWEALTQSSPDPSIFNQVSNGIRRKAWTK